MKRGKKRPTVSVEESPDLDRFGGSSDEDEKGNDESTGVENHEVDREDNADDVDVDADIDDDDDDDDDSDYDSESGGDGDGDDDDSGNDDSSIEVKEMDAGEKMSNAIGRILGTTTNNNNASSSSVVLGKTVTPLQKLQRKEKEERMTMKEKRRTNKERNLSALHLPLSIATTNSVESGGLSMSKELEQERFHRRIATRGVVALFNAITQHQRSNSNTNESRNNESSRKTGETMKSKLTKHGFLDKIKAAAAMKAGSDTKNEVDATRRITDVDSREEEKPALKPSWGALKDNYMLNPKKNWDEELSSDEDSNSTGVDIDDREKGKSRKKQRMSNRQ